MDEGEETRKRAKPEYPALYGALRQLLGILIRLRSAQGLRGQLVGALNEIGHSAALGGHLGDGLVDRGKQALGVVLGHPDAVGFGGAAQINTLQNGQLVVRLNILLSYRGIQDQSTSIR